MRILILFSLLSIVACGSTGIVPLDGGTYMISKKSTKVGFVSAAEEKAYVYGEANSFCSDLNKELETIELSMRDSGLVRQASATLEFRCI